MKYLKEGKWEDFNQNVDKIKASAKIINDDIESIRKELISNIADCMVDLDDYLIEYSFDNQDILYSDENDGEVTTTYCAYYSFEGIYDLDMFINFLENKLNGYIGKDSYLLMWDAAKTSIVDFKNGDGTFHIEGSYDEFKKDFDSGYITDKDNKFDIEFLFYDKISVHDLKKWIK